MCLFAACGIQDRGRVDANTDVFARFPPRLDAAQLPTVQMFACTNAEQSVIETTTSITCFWGFGPSPCLAL